MVKYFQSELNTMNDKLQVHVLVTMFPQSADSSNVNCRTDIKRYLRSPFPVVKFDVYLLQII